MQSISGEGIIEGSCGSGRMICFVSAFDEARPRAEQPRTVQRRESRSGQTKRGPGVMADPQASAIPTVEAA